MLEGPIDSQCELWAAVGSYAAYVTAFDCNALSFHQDSIHLSVTTVCKHEKRHAFGTVHSLCGFKDE